MESPSTRPIEVAIAVVFDQPHQQLLICKRKPDTVLGGYWEFPGGKCDAGETPEACAIREVTEELGITVRALRELPLIDHHYPHAHVRLHPFLCEWLAGTVQLLAVADARWIHPADAIHYRFPEANVALVHAVAQGFTPLAHTP
jgi:mutator protein MutT